MKGQTYLKNVATLDLDLEKCTGCGLCAIVCPHRVFEIKDQKAVITNADLCMECGACSLNCPADALNVESGVGCAAAVLTGILGGKPSRDCCVEQDSTCS